MHSWVRYSVSAYLGLLLAGSIAAPGLGGAPSTTPVASLRDSAEVEHYYLVPLQYEPRVEPARNPDSAES